MTKIIGNGHWQCRKCGGRDLYNSEETTGAYAMTLNTPGPVDPTIVNTLKSNVLRCEACQEKAIWIMSEEAVQEMNRRENRLGAWISFPSAVILGAIPFMLYEPTFETYAIFFGISAVLLANGLWSLSRKKDSPK
jgi:hypothetical protein